MLTRCTGFLGTAVLLYVAGMGSETPTFVPSLVPEQPDQVLRTRDDLKALFRNAESWLEAKQGETQFIFCQHVLPSFGCSKIDIHGWVFRSQAHRWERVFAIRINGAGQLRLSVDPNTGVLSATGTANNKLKGKTVFTFELSATEI